MAAAMARLELVISTYLVFTLLWYVYVLKILLIGLLLDENIHPMDKCVLECSAVTHTINSWI